MLHDKIMPQYAVVDAITALFVFATFSRKVIRHV